MGQTQVAADACKHGEMSCTEGVTEWLLWLRHTGQLKVQCNVLPFVVLCSKL